MKSVMRYKGLTTLEVLEGAENYNSWIAKSFTPYLKSPTLEIGSGLGTISKYFISSGELFLTDIDNGLIEHLRKKFSRSGISSSKLDISRQIPKKYEKFFSTVIVINVLEHVEKDLIALENIKKLLKKDGKVLLLVPAKQFAYTRLDKDLGHFRRYEKKELTQKLIKLGFEIEKLYFFNFLGLVSWSIRDKIEKNHKLEPYQVAIFDKIVPFLRFFESIKHPPMGISLIAIARKVN